MSSTRSAALLAPPVTKATLSDLDVNKIVNNPKLRHDINFDPDLHFRPNLDGEKGRRKSDFWGLMQKQLEAYVAD
jgi:T-complex protein 11